MPITNLSHINIAELVTPIEKEPSSELRDYDHGSTPIDERDYERVDKALINLEYAHDQAQSSAPIVNQKALAGYLLREVSYDRTTIDIGKIADNVSSYHTDLLAKLARTEGAQISTPPNAIHIALGRYVITHDYELNKDSNSNGDLKGPLWAQEFSSTELASSTLAVVDLLRPDR